MGTTTATSRRNALIQRGCELQKQIDELQKEQDAVKRELHPHFQKLNEKLSCKAGIAERKTSQSFKVEAKDVAEIAKQVGGVRYVDEYLTQKITYGVTAKMRSLLTGADDVTAVNLRGLVTIRKTESIRFIPSGGGRDR